MVSNKRVPKTFGRKLCDLDDHLYFLKESVSKLSSGDISYIKQVAGELRVLACKAGVEGLLWRIIDEIYTDDAVHVHLAGNLDSEHPLAKGLQFLFIPVNRAGRGDPRLPPTHYSLRKIIKKSEAVVVSGKGHTHENLIRAVAEQMGSAHEDEGVTPHLIELSETVLSDQNALSKMFLSVADLVLEIGERVLEESEKTSEFKRKPRPNIHVPADPVKSYDNSVTADFEGSPSPLSVEGTVMFLVDHPHADWITNIDTYDFGLNKNGPLSYQIVKHADRTMEVSVEGLTADILATRKSIPASNQPGVMVGFTWSKAEIVFYLNGVPVDTKLK